MKTTTETDPEKLTKDLNSLVEDGEHFLRSGANRLTGQAHSKVHQALERAKATGVRLKEKAVNGARATDEAIRDHPYQSIGLAFGVGVLIGVLVQRR